MSCSLTHNLARLLILPKKYHSSFSLKGIFQNSPKVTKNFCDKMCHRELSKLPILVTLNEIALKYMKWIDLLRHKETRSKKVSYARLYFWSKFLNRFSVWDERPRPSVESESLHFGGIDVSCKNSNEKFENESSSSRNIPRPTWRRLRWWWWRHCHAMQFWIKIIPKQTCPN